MTIPEIKQDQVANKVVPPALNYVRSDWFDYGAAIARLSSSLSTVVGIKPPKRYFFEYSSEIDNRVHLVWMSADKEDSKSVSVNIATKELLSSDDKTHTALMTDVVNALINYLSGIPDWLRNNSTEPEVFDWLQRPASYAYEDSLRKIWNTGTPKTDRTGTGTISLFGSQMRFDLAHGFPLVTTKKVNIRAIILELLWFLRGETNIAWLKENNCGIWDAWADENGNLGPVYGNQWRNWDSTKFVSEDEVELYKAKGYESVQQSFTTHGTPNGVVMSKKFDQIATVIEQLKTRPDDRRIIVSAWNVGELDEMALPPCHAFFQFYTRKLTLEERMRHISFHQFPGQQELLATIDKGTGDFADILDNAGVPKHALSCQLYQRSADMPVGVPFNIASYALLTMMVAQQVNMTLGEFIWTGGDCHIYSNQYEGVAEQLKRMPTTMPWMIIRRKPDSIFEYNLEDFELVDYNPHPAIKYEVAV